MTHTDIKPDGWIVRFLPEKFQPYALLARLDRPVGIGLLLLPGWWAIALASGGAYALRLEDVRLYFLFLIGAIVMRAAGCVINDLWDREIDQKVERTENRPLASGAVSVKKALVFLFVLLAIGLLILLQLSLVTIMLGVLTVPLIVLYPLMKRITWWPQLFLGLVFNFSALMGWSATTGILSFSALILYAGCVFWTLGYDTIYAHQDKKDDALIGIKSSALKLGDQSLMWVKRFYLVFFLLAFAAFFLADAGWISLILLGVAAGYTFKMLARWQPDDSASSLAVFKANQILGALILLAALL